MHNPLNVKYIHVGNHLRKPFNNSLLFPIGNSSHVIVMEIGTLYPSLLSVIGIHLHSDALETSKYVRFDLLNYLS
jgi:hypothetical protein